MGQNSSLLAVRLKDTFGEHQNTSQTTQTPTPSETRWSGYAAAAADPGRAVIVEGNINKETYQ